MAVTTGAQSTAAGALALVLACAAGAATAAGDGDAAAFGAVGWFGSGPQPHGGTGGCSGVLVSPDLVLTATHCMSRDERAPPDRPGAFVFAPGWPAQGPDAVFAAAEVTLAGPRVLLDGGLPYDLALVRLDRAVPDDIARPLPLTPFAAPGAIGVAVSYPRDTPGLPPVVRPCRVLGADGPVLGLDCPAVAGFSGSPLLVAGPDGWEIAAIIVARVPAPEGTDEMQTCIRSFAVTPPDAFLARTAP